MIRICPKPIPWNDVFKCLKDYSETHVCEPSHPPVPLILNGWVYSNDIQKQERWQATVRWAARNGCDDLVERPSSDDFYTVSKPTSYTVGPGGGPMCRDWDFETKDRPSTEQLKNCMVMLTENWHKIVGEELAPITCPVAFTGKKARRLLVFADENCEAPWGGWNSRSSEESKRRTFTRFRRSINKAVKPHEVDHVDFKMNK